MLQPVDPIRAAIAKNNIANALIGPAFGVARVIIDPVFLGLAAVRELRELPGVDHPPVIQYQPHRAATSG
jgi:hypothetical protein